MATYDPANMAKLRRFKELAPEATSAFFAFNDAVFKEGALSVKVKELIAVAVALTTQCSYCIDIHTKKARQAGVTDEELAEATLVSAALRAGGSLTHGTHCFP